MANAAENKDMSSADPRHRSFRLTPPTSHEDAAHVDSLEEAAHGWVRLIDHKGVPFAVRIDSITQVVGPYPHDGGFGVRLISDAVAHAPITFPDERSADVFVDDLLFDS